MCIYADDWDTITLRSGSPIARKEHCCDECGRTIEPGERYRFWVVLSEGDFLVQKMCAHCEGTIDLGAALTGCPKSWYWGLIFDLSPDDGGFVGDIIHNHDLTTGQKWLMVRCVRGRRRQWRDRHGALLPIPAAPESLGDTG